MAAYPSVAKLSRITPINDRRSDISEAGYVRQVDLSAEQVYQLDLEHPYVSSTDRSTLAAFWLANKGTTVTVTAGDGYTYDCLFVNEPAVEAINGTWWNVRAQLVGKRN